jgi:hypothetical protein
MTKEYPMMNDQAAAPATAPVSSSALRHYLERLRLLCSAGFPACGFWRLFRLRGAPKRRFGATAASRQFLAGGTRDKNVPQTRRQECLRYLKAGTALVIRYSSFVISLPIQPEMPLDPN